MWHINQVTILEGHSLVVVPGLWDAKWPTFFGQEDLKVKKVPGVLHEARGGKQMI